MIAAEVGLTGPGIISGWLDGPGVIAANVGLTGPGTISS